MTDIIHNNAPEGFLDNGNIQATSSDNPLMTNNSERVPLNSLKR